MKSFLNRKAIISTIVMASTASFLFARSTLTPPQAFRGTSMHGMTEKSYGNDLATSGDWIFAKEAGQTRGSDRIVAYQYCNEQGWIRRQTLNPVRLNKDYVGDAVFGLSVASEGSWLSVGEFISNGTSWIPRQQSLYRLDQKKDEWVVGSIRNIATPRKLGASGDAMLEKRNALPDNARAVLLATSLTGPSSANDMSQFAQVMGAAGDDEGNNRTVRIMRRAGPALAWYFEVSIEMPRSGSKTNWSFGSAIALGKNVLAIGAPGWDRGARGNTGAVFIYVYDTSLLSWSLSQVLSGPDSTNGDAFGASVAIHEDRLLIGAVGADSAEISDTGACYTFVQNRGFFDFEKKFQPSTLGARDQLGSFLAIGDRFAVACTQAASIASNRTCVTYAFDLLNDSAISSIPLNGNSMHK